MHVERDFPTRSSNIDSATRHARIVMICATMPLSPFGNSVENNSGAANAVGQQTADVLHAIFEIALNFLWLRWRLCDSLPSRPQSYALFEPYSTV